MLLEERQKLSTLPLALAPPGSAPPLLLAQRPLREEAEEAEAHGPDGGLQEQVPGPGEHRRCHRAPPAPKRRAETLPCGGRSQLKAMAGPPGGGGTSGA